MPTTIKLLFIATSLLLILIFLFQIYLSIRNQNTKFSFLFGKDSKKLKFKNMTDLCDLHFDLEDKINQLFGPSFMPLTNLFCVIAIFFDFKLFLKLIKDPNLIINDSYYFQTLANLSLIITYLFLIQLIFEQKKFIYSYYSKYKINSK